MVENNLDFIKVNCGAVSYLIVRGSKMFSVLYSEPMKKPQQFARTNTLNMAYDMVAAHLKGKHQCVFKLSELLDCSSPVTVGNFIGVKVV